VNVFNACVKALGLIGGALMPAFVLAEDAASPLLTTTPVASAGKVFFFLLVVVGMILLLAWLVNKTRAGQLAGAGRNLKMIAVMPVGTREKVAVIQAGDQQLVIGITSQQITTLAELKEPLSNVAERPADFSEILKMAVRK